MNTGEAKAASQGNSLLILEGDSQMVAMATNHPEFTSDWHTKPIVLLSSKAGLHLRLPDASTKAHVIAKWAAGSVPTDMYPISSFSCKSGKDTSPPG